MKLFKSKKKPAYFSRETTNQNREEILEAVNSLTPDTLRLCAVGYFVVMSKMGITPKGILETLES